MKNICPICKTSIGKGNFCPSCGLPKEITLKRWKFNRPEFQYFKDLQLCAKCETPNPFGAKFCRNCGQDISNQAKDLNGHGWVDLGLSVLWSTETMVDYYPWRDSSTELTLYSERLKLDFKGDEKDVASVKWGKKWRVPTKEEFIELIDTCKWEKIVLSQLNEHALKVTGPNGNYIILKTTGYAGCRRNDPYYLGFHESEYSYCSFWTSSELLKDGFPPAGATFIFSGYEKFKPTLTPLQEHNANSFNSPMFRGVRSYLKNIDLTNRLDEVENKSTQSSDTYERKKNEDTDMKKRHTLWLETPFKLEKSKHCEEHCGIHPNAKQIGLAVRPVADKKWKGKL